MVASTIKVPRIMNADKPGLVTDPGTLMFNNDSGMMEYINSSGFYANSNAISQQLWVTASGNDLNPGTPDAPFASYDAARVFAELTASPTNRFLIKVIGDQTAVGDILFGPYIDVDFEDCIFTSGDAFNGIGLDPAFAEATNATVYITGFRPVSSFGMSLIWDETTAVANWIIFINPNFAQCDFGIVQSTGGVSSLSNDNGVAIFGDSNPLGNNFPSGLFIEQVKSRIENMDFANAITYQLFDDDYAINHYLYNCTMTDLINVRSSGNGAQNVNLRNCFITNPISIDCQGGKIFIDSNSYSQIPVLGLFNTFADIIIYDSTDGIIVNTLSPVNYSFVSGSYSFNALTGFLQGIDNSLPKSSGSATLVAGAVTVASVTVATGDSIELTCTAAGGAQGFITVTYNPGVSFTLTSSSALDTSTYKWKNLGA